MRPTRLVQLRQGVFSATTPDGRMALLRTATCTQDLGRPGRDELALLRRLAAGPLPEPDLLAAAPDGNLVARLHSGGWLTVHFGLDDRPLMSVRPLGTQPDPEPEPPKVPRLCRFAMLRRDGHEFVVESPLAPAVVTLHDPAVLTLVHGLAVGALPEPAGLPDDVTDALLTELARLRLVHEADDEDEPDLAGEQWSAHELLFHSRSRAGDHDLPTGATPWAAGRFPPLPARSAAPPSPAIALPCPGPEPLAHTDFVDVLDRRRTLRAHDGDDPLTLRELGEFLYRSARVVRTGVDGTHEITMRPSPSGGALHALELYPVVTAVAGLTPGMYHYDPFDHVLREVPAAPHTLRLLTGQAAAAAGIYTEPQVLLVAACRFGRIMWKYQGIGYALALKDFGALTQTMYLVATAMGLAPCALGAGDSTVFAAATGLDPLTESAVGEFMLGRHAPISDRDRHDNAL